MVVQQVPHHQHEVAAKGHVDELLALGFVEYQGFFHVHMLARQQGFAGDGVVGLGRGGDHHAGDIRVRQDFAEGQAGLDAGILLAKGLQGNLVAVADAFEGADLVIVAHQVLAPEAPSPGSRKPGLEAPGVLAGASSEKLAGSWTREHQSEAPAPPPELRKPEFTPPGKIRRRAGDLHW